MNIYDFAGNEWEWTLEYTGNTSAPCSNQGGEYDSYGSDFPASGRGVSSTTNSINNIGSRVALY
jgi:formylglycine-generating enzyme required for sulfatase activity